MIEIFKIVNETASDLVVMLTIMSSLRDKVIPKDWIAFGEVGLTGDQYANSHLVQAESVFELYYVDQNLGLR
jgi:predicted ATP-dependent serine protease